MHAEGPLTMCDQEAAGGSSAYPKGDPQSSRLFVTEFSVNPTNHVWTHHTLVQSNGEKCFHTHKSMLTWQT